MSAGSGRTAASARPRRAPGHVHVMPLFSGLLMLASICSPIARRPKVNAHVRSERAYAAPARRRGCGRLPGDSSRGKRPRFLPVRMLCHLAQRHGKGRG
jgi:hypothetical protein